MKVTNINKKWSLIGILVIIGCLLLLGCGQTENRPDVQTEDDMNNQQKGITQLEAEPQISLFIHESNEIKEISIEEYLLGVVAAEMEPTWPQEALAAQAILARTFTLERMESTGGVPERGTDASTDIEEFQAYDVSRINDNVKKAVEETRGEVATYEGKLIKAWFFAEAGGLTAASALEGLTYDKEPTPYIQSVEDPGSEITTEENKAWQVSFPLSDVQTKLRDFTGNDPGMIDNIEIIEKGPSDRVTTVKIGKVTTSGPSLRLALGSTEMKSTLLTKFAIEGDNLVVAGKGFGHGVGLSQWGAKALAEQGKDGEEIVQYFFNDVKIEKLYQ